MSYIISIHYLFEFLIFISVIPNSITIKSTIEFAFLNGFNVIRCSNNQVQVYEQDEKSTALLSTILTCNNKYAIYDSNYAGFVWNELKIICSSTLNQVHEEIYVGRKFHSSGLSDKLPDAKGQLSPSDELYELQVKNNDDGNNIVIESENQPASDSYFKGDFKQRTVYIRFPDHPIICRIKFKGAKNNPCSAGTDPEIEDVNYACFYNPGADEEPTVEDMLAEFRQVDEAEKPDNENAYVLDLDKPKISTDDSLESDENDDPNKPSNSGSKNSSNNSNKKKTSFPSKSPKNKKKSSIGKIIGLIFGILLFICLIGGIAFYFIRKNRANQSSVLSSSSSGNIETGNNKDLSLPVRKESQQSLGTEVKKNEPSVKDKPNIALQKSTANKRQRAGTSMAINDDI